MTLLQTSQVFFLYFSLFLATFCLFLCRNVTTSVSVCYQELITRTAPATAVVFPLNFCTGIKTALALKLWEILSVNWDLDLQFNIFVEGFGNNSWAYLHRQRKNPSLHACSYWLYHLWRFSSPLSNKHWKPHYTISVYSFSNILQRGVGNSK